jgi:hypothetical protein
VKRLAFAAAAVAVIAYCVDNVRHVINWEEEDANAATVIDSIRQTAPGWQR